MTLEDESDETYEASSDSEEEGDEPAENGAEADALAERWQRWAAYIHKL